MLMVFQCLFKNPKIQHFPSSVFQQQILPKMVSSSTDLHHKVADIKDINFAGMVKVHARCLLYCLHLVCICLSQATQEDLAEDFGLLYLILILQSCRSVISVKVQEEGRTQDKAWKYK